MIGTLDNAYQDLLLSPPDFDLILCFKMCVLCTVTIFSLHSLQVRNIF